MKVWEPGSFKKAIMGSIIAGLILALAHDTLKLTNTSVLDLLLSIVALKFLIALLSAFIFYFIFYIIKVSSMIGLENYNKIRAYLKFLGCEYCMVSVIMLLVFWLRQSINKTNLIITGQILSYNFILIPLFLVVFIGIYEYYRYFKLFGFKDIVNEKERELSVGLLQRSVNVEGGLVFSFTTFLILVLK